MRALTIYEPLASGIAYGLKHFETRSWATSYRGLLAIHAGKKFVNEPDLVREFEAVTHLNFYPHWGCIVAVATLADCIPTRSANRADPWMELGYFQRYRELRWGDWSYGRFLWRLTGVVRLKNPIQCRGYQGLWTPGPGIAARLESVHYYAHVS